MLFVNLIFIFFWLVAYLGNAEWIASCVKRFRTEHDFICRNAVEPYIPIKESDKNNVLLVKN